MEFINLTLSSVFILSVYLVATLSYFIIYSKDNLKNGFFRLPVIIKKLYVFIFVGSVIRRSIILGI